MVGLLQGFPSNGSPPKELYMLLTWRDGRAAVADFEDFRVQLP